MLVCAPPRTGATKYCLDLQTKTGLEFIGELNPTYITSCGDSNRKAPNHETSFQPDISKEQFVSYLTNPEKYIVLCNQSPHLLVHYSDLVILRNDLESNLLSIANFFIKVMPYLGAEGIIQHVSLSHQSIYAMLSYLEVHSKPIVWYEDHFNMSGTRTDYIDNHKNGKVIKRFIKSLIKSNDATFMLKNLYDTSNRLKDSV